MKPISRMLVANRGEIAVRVIRACRDMGIESIAAVSEADKESMPAKMADRAVCIGPARPQESYLRVGTIVAAALGTGAGAVHPGYGFLAEQPELAEACALHGLLFVGPKAESIRTMGDKLLARSMAHDLGVPVIPGSTLVRNLEESITAAERVGFPILLKAAAGGGGKGIKIVKNSADLKTNFDEASAEARAAFGDDRLYIERYIQNARHIEIQIFGDCFGNLVHLFERDCTLQRRYQKVLEEAPSPAIPASIREELCRAALAIARRIAYENAGTIEFVFDQDEERFYFLEMNTRIQVEHPVTEMLTGLDLVKEQIRVAEGKSLSFTQGDVKVSGHAMECRINAESPAAGFRPAPGRIIQWTPPGGPGIRVDSHCYTGYFVPPYYDSLLAKVITAGIDRFQAIHRMQEALGVFRVSGVDTTIPFHQFMLTHADFLNGNVNTCWIHDIMQKEHGESEGNQLH